MFLKKYFLIILTACVLLTFFHLKDNIKNHFVKSNPEKSEGEKEELKVARDEYFFNIMKDPYINAIPENIRINELEFAKKIPQSTNLLLKESSSSKINWQEIGPFDVGGRTRAIVIDAANPNIIVAGGVSGGIWKSTDKGNTWKMKSSLSQVLSVTSIAQDIRPGFRNNWYAVGGEYRGNSASARGGSGSFYGGGFLKSTNNGETWIEIPTNIVSPTGVFWNSDFSYASKVIINPTTGTLFVCANGSGILQSADGGTTWGDVTNTYIIGGRNDHYYSDIVVNQSGVLVASLSQFFPNQSGNPQDYSPGVYRSTNDGLSWTNITPSSFPTSHARSVMAFIPSFPNWFYIFTYQNTRTNDRENISLFRINALTGEFFNLSANLPDLGSQQGYIDSQLSYNMAIAVHPTDENYVFIAGTSLFRSFDRFTTKPDNPKLNWIGGYHQTAFFYPKLHPDVHTLVFNPSNPDELWVGHDGGISYVSDCKTINYGTYMPWVDSDNGYAVTQFYTASIPYSNNDDRYAGGTQDNGTPYFRSSNGNNTLSKDVTSGDGSYLYFGSEYFYGSTQNGNLRRSGYSASKDINNSNYTSFEPDSATGQLFINPFVVDPVNEDFMYYISGRVLWRNDRLPLIPNNLSKTMVGWTKIDNILPSGYTFTTLTVSRLNSPHVLYLGATGSNQPKIFKITNSTSSTTAVEITPTYPGNGSGQVPNTAYVHSIAVNPKNSNEIIVVLSNYNTMSLWYSNNGGASWSDIEGNLAGQFGPSIRSATILPISSGNIYLLGTSTGVYSTSQLNGSSTFWTQEGANTIGNVVVENVISRDLDGTVVAATHGRGLFVGKVEVTSVDENDLLPSKFELSQNYPNPFNPSTSIQYVIPSPIDQARNLQDFSSTSSPRNDETHVILKVYDLLGREVATLVDEFLQPGTYNSQFSIRNSQLPSGVYFYQLKAAKFTKTKKMILMK